MAAIKVGNSNKITIPKEIFKELALKPGDYLEARVTEDGSLLLVPKTLIPKDQEWFWTERWQRKEREADEAIARGEVFGPYNSTEEAIRALDNEDL